MIFSFQVFFLLLTATFKGSNNMLIEFYHLPSWVYLTQLFIVINIEKCRQMTYLRFICFLTPSLCIDVKDKLSIINAFWIFLNEIVNINLTWNFVDYEWLGLVFMWSLKRLKDRLAMTDKCYCLHIFALQNKLCS